MVRSPKFGVFVPQGWKMDLVEIDDPVAKYAAMTAVAQAADAEQTIDSIWVYDHFHTIPEPTLEDDLRMLDDQRHPPQRDTETGTQNRADGQLQ